MITKQCKICETRTTLNCLGCNKEYYIIPIEAIDKKDMEKLQKLIKVLYKYD